MIFGIKIWFCLLAIKVIPVATATDIKNGVGKISQLNEQISNDISDAVAKAEALNHNQIFDPQDLDGNKKKVKLYNSASKHNFEKYFSNWHGSG